MEQLVFLIFLYKQQNLIIFIYSINLVQIWSIKLY